MNRAGQGRMASGSGCSQRSFLGNLSALARSRRVSGWAWSVSLRNADLDIEMNLEKSTKLIAKKVKKGFQGYPQISLAYFGESPDLATEVVVGFTAEEGAVVQEQKFTSKIDVRKDETIQTTLVKVIERADARTVLEAEGVAAIQ